MKYPRVQRLTSADFICHRDTIHGFWERRGESFVDQIRRQLAGGGGSNGGGGGGGGYRGGSRRGGSSGSGSQGRGGTSGGGNQTVVAVVEVEADELRGLGGVEVTTTVSKTARAEWWLRRDSASSRSIMASIRAWICRRFG